MPFLLQISRVTYRFYLQELENSWLKVSRAGGAILILNTFGAEEVTLKMTYLACKELN
jgi:hypothetical protein